LRPTACGRCLQPALIHIVVTALTVLRARFAREDGVALVVALGVLFSMTVAGTSVYVFTAGNARSSEVSKDREIAFTLAEAGVAEALSVLNNALDPLTASTLSPERTVALEGGIVKYSGVLSGQTWTITAKGIVDNPTGNGGQFVRTLTRRAQVYGVNSGATVSAWSRFYHDNANVCLTIKDVTIPTSISARGNICMQGTAKITGAESRFEAGGSVIMSGGTATSVIRSTGAGAGWTNPGFVGASDNQRATTVLAAGAQSANLDATSFGLTIPANAQLTGITASVERGASSSNYIGDVDVYLLKNGSPVGTDHATTPDWGSADAIRTYGTTTDLWGTTWTPADVNASNFGLRLKVDNDAPGNITASVDHVQLTVYYSLPPATSIGASGSPIYGAYVAGTCTFGGQSSHAPCSSVDQVYAGTISQQPETLAKPEIDLAHWYSNAKPGPMHNCTTGSFPGGFDNDTTYNASRPGSPEITPEGTSYTCQVKDAQGNIEGELSWNHLTRVLKIKGTIFVDGDLRFDDDGTIVHYQGRGIIYAADDIEYDEIVCAGGSGNTNCITNGMSNWDPTQNLLIVLSGKNSEFDQGATQQANQPSGLQGIIYAKGQCTIHQNFHLSGPVICDTISLPSDAFGWPTYYTWPPLGSLVDGQIYADPTTAGDFLVAPLEQSG
jgi:Tfp pilus assembly protein PilX